MKFLLSFALFFSVSSSAAWAQSSSPIFSPRGTSSFTTSAPPESRPVVTGSPLSYEESHDHSQVLADGTRITQKTFTILMYRDSAGRTRMERPLFFGAFLNSSPALQNLKFIEITDPVAGAQYILDTQNHVAYRFPFTAFQRQVVPRTLPAAANPNAIAAPQNRSSSTSASALLAHPQFPQRSTESLGTQVMEGVYVEGQRTTNVFPTGSEGNDRPITQTCETWTSPDLQMPVLSKCSDLRSGDNVTRLTNIDRSEPDPALFQVSADYSIVDGHDRVTMKFQSPHN
jgi:hypothetical protein